MCLFKGDNRHLSGLDLPKTGTNIKMFISTAKVSSFKLVYTGFVTSVCVCVCAEFVALLLVTRWQ